MANNIRIAGLRLGMLFFIAGVIFFRMASWWESVVRNSVLNNPLPTLLPFPPPKLEGVYAPNILLHSISKIGEGLLLQPEDLAFDARDGWIKKNSYNSCVGW